MREGRSPTKQSRLSAAALTWWVNFSLDCFAFARNDGNSLNLYSYEQALGQSLYVIPGQSLYVIPGQSLYVIPGQSLYVIPRLDRGSQL
ncbi:MAG: hypothetical protein HYW48_01225 [Deltaproteobacteria bacterium]|nr:hypothetical protein [Deltaproteobacteria bacterium]